MASKLIVNEIEHTFGSGTAVTMAKATIADATITDLTSGTIGSGVTGGSGLTALGTVTAGTLGSGVTFPTGHVLQSKYATTTSASITNTSPTWGTYQATLDITSPTAGNELQMMVATGGYQNTNIHWCYMGMMINDSVNTAKVIVGLGAVETTASYFHHPSTGIPYSIPGGGGSAFGIYTIPSSTGTITCRVNLYVTGGTWTTKATHLIVQEIQT